MKDSPSQSSLRNSSGKPLEREQKRPLPTRGSRKKAPSVLDVFERQFLWLCSEGENNSPVLDVIFVMTTLVFERLQAVNFK